jgi:hypothetical protein
MEAKAPAAFANRSTKGIKEMASPAQMAANRRNAQRSTGPRTEEGKKAVRLNAVKHGMTAEVIVLAHESAADYHEIRATLIEDYAPATSKELMLVDQIAAGYWRTIRARRFETALFDEQIVAKKRYHRKDLEPNPGQDDRVAAAVLQEIEPKELDNYFRYDGTISRDYYRAINTLEKMQAARRREEDRQERKREKAARELDRILKRPDPDTIAQSKADNRVEPIGFVSSYALEQTHGQHPNPWETSGSSSGTHAASRL